jgi:hypothetical protein
MLGAASPPEICGVGSAERTNNMGIKKIVCAFGLVALVATGGIRAETYREPKPQFTDWVHSPDGKVSICLTTHRTTFSSKEVIVMRCAIRNNTKERIAILRPFWHAGISHEQLFVVGPTGRVGYSGPEYGVECRTEDVVEIAAQTIVDWTLPLERKYLKALEVPGLYRIAYSYASFCPANLQKTNFWNGDLATATVSIMRSEARPNKPSEATP